MLRIVIKSIHFELAIFLVFMSLGVIIASKILPPLFFIPPYVHHFQYSQFHWSVLLQILYYLYFRYYFIFSFSQFLIHPPLHFQKPHSPYFQISKKASTDIFTLAIDLILTTYGSLKFQSWLSFLCPLFNTYNIIMISIYEKYVFDRPFIIWSQWCARCVFSWAWAWHSGLFFKKL